jgi:signal transduction histidine kinase
MSVQAAMIVVLLYEHGRRRRAEVMARSTMSELTHMNRVATAGELSASIAHEVSQPLSGITTSAGAALRWLAAETPNVEKARAAMVQVVSASHRAAEIVTSVRAMFKRESTERRRVDINELVLTVVGIVRLELEKAGAVLQTELDRNIPDVECDPVQVQQVILNLVMNAIEAMHSVRPRVLSVRTKMNGPHMIYVAVEDTGGGIDPSNLPLIFKALVTTKESGMGMGLSICRSIIEHHHGRIWASAGARRGSIFQFELPTTAAEGSTGTSSARPPQSYEVVTTVAAKSK